MNYPYPISKGEDAVAQRAIEHREDSIRSGQATDGCVCCTRRPLMWPRAGSGEVGSWAEPQALWTVGRKSA